MLLKFNATLLSVGIFLLSGCAELNSGLAQVNSALGSINGSLSGNSALSMGGKSIPDKQTAVYILKNMKISETSAFNSEGTGYGKGRRLTGEAYNKTGKLIRLTVSIPIYDKGGFREGALWGEITLSPKEKKRFEFETHTAIPEGGKLDLNKFEVSRETF
ncbi:hypothetical protein [Neisseria musculi]|uniref:Lipoprotein n=1 Tax=Neisseria musculi TaxID=1815583 RepID=A0A7H1M891_9NEIS|nr:hypothetical protein [Neisseria musculi]QNT57856.1 hypothetical protein H7A79_0476 [Neisseria musculi]